jgi:hypothetical protein
VNSTENRTLPSLEHPPLVSYCSLVPQFVFTPFLPSSIASITSSVHHASALQVSATPVALALPTTQLKPMHDEVLAAALDLYLAHCAQASAIASRIEAEMQEASVNSQVEAAKVHHQIVLQKLHSSGAIQNKVCTPAEEEDDSDKGGDVVSMVNSHEV